MMAPMSNKLFKAAIIVMVLLFSASAVILSGNVCQANPVASHITPITILADGTIDPAGVPITRSDDTYTLKGSMRCAMPWTTKFNFQYLIIQRSNIILDGVAVSLSLNDKPMPEFSFWMTLPLFGAASAVLVLYKWRMKKS
jgi:hypothetical protein